MADLIDKTTEEEEFKFRFKQVNFWSLHDMYTALRVVQGETNPEGEIEFMNENGERWNINSRDEMKLHALLSKADVEYTAIIRGGKVDWYKDVIDSYLNYKKYFLVGMGNENA